jgi:hypothetical protein
MGEKPYGFTTFSMPLGYSMPEPRLSLPQRAWRTIRGVYGDQVTVTAKRPWSRSSRHSARLAAAVIDDKMEDITRETYRRISESLFSGIEWVDPRG